MPKVVFISGDEDRSDIVLKHLFDLYIVNHFSTPILKSLEYFNEIINTNTDFLNRYLYYCIDKNGIFKCKSSSDLSIYVDLGYADYYQLDDFLHICPFLIGDKVELVGIPGIKFTISSKIYLGKELGFSFKLKEDDSIDWKLSDFKRE